MIETWKTIKLNKGYEAIVDAEDYENLIALTWHVTEYSGLFYACSSKYLGGGRKGAKYTQLKMHRLIMNAKKGQIVDHINHNGLDNRKSNLRLCTTSQNMQNSRKIKARETSSKYKGVCWEPVRRKWVSYITCNRDRYNLGGFDSEIDAAIVYNFWAKMYHGDFAHLNEIII